MIEETPAEKLSFGDLTQPAVQEAFAFQAAMTKLQQDAGNAQSEPSKREIINYKPGFQWVKFRVAYNGIAQHSNEVTAILNAYKLYAENKYKAKRVSI